MTQPKTINKVQLCLVVCAVLVLMNLASGRQMVAAVETASFRISLSLTTDTVRFRTASSGNGQFDLSRIFEAVR